MSTTKRKISKDLWKKLTKGDYKEIIEFASKRENDLDVQIRGNYLNIYYRGGNLLKLQPRSMYFDEFYFHTNVTEIRKTHILEHAKAGDAHCIDLWDDYIKQRNDMLNILKEKGGMPIYCKKMKDLMDAWESALNTIKISHEEKNAQQQISMNNRGDTPYTVIDVEYAVSRNSPFSYNGKLGKKIPRFDIIAVDNTGQLYVIELKTGLGSIGGTSGIHEHIDCFNYTIGRDKDGEFISEMKDLLEQKIDLGLIDKRIKIDENKKPQFIFAFSDKEGKKQYCDFVEACRKRKYFGKIIYLDNSYCLKDSPLKITIHCGTDRIGGCVTEYEYKGYRLFVDYGEQLPGAKKTKPLEIEGLTKGDLSKSALLITHYHGDHIGCIKDLPKELPIYMGEVGRDIQLTLSEHLSSVKEEQKAIIERLQVANSFSPGKSFWIGPFKITPVTIDHSAFDAYAFKIETESVRVFHTGDFRLHGFRSGNIKKMIEKYVGKVDFIVCEGTNVARPNSSLLTEKDLQHQFEEALHQKQGHIVYLSSTNIDRLFSLYHAALKVGVPFFVDAYQKKIMDVVTDGNSLWGKSQLYHYGEYPPIVLQREGDHFRINDKFKDVLGKKGYVLIARANLRFDKLIEQLPDKKVKYLSQWKGYLDEKKDAYNEALAKALGKDYIYLHTSGHCDVKSLHKFFSMLQPKAIIPIHTDNPNRFVKLFGNEWYVIRLHDGKTMEVIDCL